MSSSNPDQRRRMPFKVPVQRLREAYDWLAISYQFYHDVAWDDSVAARWDVEEPDIVCLE